MDLEQLQIGDIVFATTDLYNDGSVPGFEDNELVAKAGSRGVMVNSGHLEDDPNQKLYLIRFENADLDLGPAIGCWPDELEVKIEGMKEKQASAG